MFNKPFDAEFNALSEINISKDHGTPKKIFTKNQVFYAKKTPKTYLLPGVTKK